MKNIIKNLPIMQKLRTYLNNEASDINRFCKYVNNYTGEVTNHPFLESLRVYVYFDFTFKNFVKHLFSWKRT